MTSKTASAVIGEYRQYVFPASGDNRQMAVPKADLRALITEIERLQAEVERLKEALTDEVQYATEYALAAINRDLEAEIERLSMKLDKAKEWLGEMVNLGAPQNGRGCLFCGAGKHDRREEHKPNCEVLEIRSFLIVLEKQEIKSRTAPVDPSTCAHEAKVSSAFTRNDDGSGHSEWRCSDCGCEGKSEWPARQGIC